MKPTADFVVVGGGVVGLTIAMELRRRHRDASVVVLEKEPRCGAHASGRNSGVVHAGFYYAADSQKAALCREGNRRLVAWCEERGVAVRRSGKLVVARSDADHAGLDELLRRGRAAGVRLEPVDEDEAHRLEPLAKTAGRALYAPDTAAVDPQEVMAALAAHADETGVTIHTGVTWRRPGPIACGYLVNAAGLYADRIAHAYGFGERYCIIPFKGLYLYGNASAPALRMHVYPVPDLGMPFLGVHFTVTADSHVKIGPTALPAPWREAYGDHHPLDGFSARELVDSALNGLALLRNASIRRHALVELPKISRRVLLRHAAELVPSARLDQFDRWGRAGIRAQLFDRTHRELVMDFLYEADDKSLHVLNAVSPAFTSAFPFADTIVDAIDRSMR